MKHVDLRFANVMLDQGSYDLNQRYMSTVLIILIVEGI